MTGDSGAVAGLLLLDELLARIEVEPLSAPPDRGGRPGSSELWEAYSMLTLSSALLLGRLGGALVHAGAVVAPDGRAWLLVGDTHAGKSTTCVSLLEAGWGCLSDDHVVLLPSPGRTRVVGWLRPFHLDSGWEEGRLTGVRAEVDPASLGVSGWQGEAPLAGVLLPQIRAEERTELLPASSGEVLAALIRQSPWLMADRAAAQGVLDSFTALAQGPGHRLLLGREVYGRSDRLDALLRPIVVGHGSAS